MSAQGVQLLFFFSFLIIMYIFLIYPQRKRIKEHSKLILELKVKDKVLTVGGIHGRISEISENTIFSVKRLIGRKFLKALCAK